MYKTATVVLKSISKTLTDFLVDQDYLDTDVDQGYISAEDFCDLIKQVEGRSNSIATELLEIERDLADADHDTKIDIHQCGVILSVGDPSRQ